MKLQGYVLSALLWGLGFFLVGSMIFNTIAKNIETHNFEVRTAAALVKASNNKMTVLDVRIQDRSLIIWFGVKSLASTTSMGLTEREDTNVDAVFAEAAEWAIINRDIVVMSYRLSRRGIANKVFVTVRFECLARDIAEELAEPDCTPYQRWIEVKDRNRRFG